ncbi:MULTISPECIES: Flp family type IVb pilin [unclassified Novosphingobium]|uniref:Flp family type IVb pilin n=1 Tax=unclassified Novosphingobium TaxID=2644732 RepID=UPI00135778CE|nr:MULTISPECIES: Flp family type IVb pilin [unclassified Novosphingobium]
MMTSIQKLMTRLRSDERGLTAVEYAVLGAIIVGAIGAVGISFRASLVTAFAGIFTAT